MKQYVMFITCYRGEHVADQGVRHKKEFANKEEAIAWFLKDLKEFKGYSGYSPVTMTVYCDGRVVYPD